jgi:hypothetical protein
VNHDDHAKFPDSASGQYCDALEIPGDALDTSIAPGAAADLIDARIDSELRALAEATPEESRGERVATDTYADSERWGQALKTGRGCASVVFRLANVPEIR